MQTEMFWNRGVNTLWLVSRTLFFNRITRLKGSNPTWNQVAASKSADSSSSDRIPERFGRDTRPKDYDTSKDVPIKIHLDEAKGDNDLVTLHNIIYYLYTGCVNRDVLQCVEDAHRYKSQPGFPAQPYLFYKKAKKFLIDDLTQHAFGVLRETLTARNVVERLFAGPDDLRL